MTWTGHLARCGAGCLLFGQLSAFGADADLPRRCAELRDVATAEGAAVIFRGAASLRFPREDLAAAAKRIELQPNERLHLLSAEGELLFSTDPELLEDQAFVLPSALWGSRRALFERAAREATGEGSYIAFDALKTRAMRCEAAWVTAGPSRAGVVLLLEREHPADRTPEAPLMGPWIGAYAHAGRTVGPGGELDAERKSAGQLSVLMAQEGARLLVRWITSDGQITVAGLKVDDRFTAGHALLPQDGGSPEIWFIEGTYAPEEERVRGTLYTSSPSKAEIRTFYLQPVVPPERE